MAATQAIELKIQTKANAAYWLSKAKSGDYQYYYSEGTSDFNGAEAACVEWGGHLLSIEDADELAMVGALADARRLGETDAWTTTFWIGLSKDSEYGSWEWSDGATSTYRDWAPNEPHTFDYCSYMYHDSYATEWIWYSYGCSYDYHYICKKPKDQYVAEPSCAPGSHWAADFGECLTCPAGTYNDYWGAWYCMECSGAEAGATACSGWSDPYYGECADWSGYSTGYSWLGSGDYYNDYDVASCLSMCEGYSGVMGCELYYMSSCYVYGSSSGAVQGDGGSSHRCYIRI